MGSHGPSLLPVLTLPASVCGDAGQAGMGPLPGLRGPGAFCPCLAPPWLSAAWRQGSSGTLGRRHSGVKEKLATPRFGPRRSCLRARPRTRWSLPRHQAVSRSGGWFSLWQEPWGGGVVPRDSLLDSSRQWPSGSGASAAGCPHEAWTLEPQGLLVASNPYDPYVSLSVPPTGWWSEPAVSFAACR